MCYVKVDWDATVEKYKEKMNMRDHEKSYWLRWYLLDNTS